MLQQRRDAERQLAEAGNGTEKVVAQVVPKIAPSPASMREGPVSIEDFEELK